MAGAHLAASLAEKRPSLANIPLEIREFIYRYLFQELLIVVYNHWQGASNRNFGLLLDRDSIMGASLLRTNQHRLQLRAFRRVAMCFKHTLRRP